MQGAFQAGPAETPLALALLLAGGQIPALREIPAEDGQIDAWQLRGQRMVDGLMGAGPFDVAAIHLAEVLRLAPGFRVSEVMSNDN